MSRSSRARVAIVAAIASMALAASCVAPRVDSEPPLRPEEFAGVPEVLDLSDQLVKAHNARRAKAGLPPLFPNPLLDAAAEGHARDMADRRKMAHRGGTAPRRSTGSPAKGTSLGRPARTSPTGSTTSTRSWPAG